jgi:UDP-N-acetylglucosamine--N-acetylmuramyl-(pentapeptide) pyrophosphoryl-undecaprenol N-acetylglucosamine transferase
MSSGKLVFAGGGSGGHVFPLLAVAEAIGALAPGVEIVFVGTERGLETRLVPERGYSLELVQVLPLRGDGVRGAARGVSAAARAIPACTAILRRHQPLAVLSIGGYAAGPLALAARLLKIPLAIVEPNAEIGLSNRLIAPLAARAYTAFPRAGRHFRERAVFETGLPLRRGFFPVPYARRPGALRVLVFGGSQGARVLNEAVPRALAKLAVAPSVVHQCGPREEAQTRALYAELGLADAARVVPFLSDMPRAIADADVVIGRAGAGTVSEVCAIGRPSLLIPYPFAGDHQRFNAVPLVEGGAAVMIASSEATPERLASELERLEREPGLLERMAESARRLGRPAAARTIALDLLGLCRFDWGTASVASSEVN